MIKIKSEKQIELMRKAGKIVKDTLELVREHAKEGVTTKELDELAYNYIISQGARPNFLHYNGFPATLCTSIDEEVVHGIPDGRVLEEGMLLKIDTGAAYKGMHSDAARTIRIGKVGPKKEKLARITEECFFAGVNTLREGTRLGDLGAAIQEHAESNGFSVVRALVGHGIGEALHEEPNVPNYGVRGRGERILAGMALAIEPMICMGGYEVKLASDNWTVITADNKPSAHYENTVIVTADGIEILTL
ncbi:MAG: type I methionyl aminopeptidase [Christensenellales bacterium]